jgi:hypothetical protein
MNVLPKLIITTEIGKLPNKLRRNYLLIIGQKKVWSLLTVDESGKPIETKKEVYVHLAAELIDNNYNGG